MTTRLIDGAVICALAATGFTQWYFGIGITGTIMWAWFAYRLYQRKRGEEKKRCKRALVAIVVTSAIGLAISLQQAYAGFSITSGVVIYSQGVLTILYACAHSSRKEWLNRAMCNVYSYACALVAPTVINLSMFTDAVSLHQGISFATHALTLTIFLRFLSIFRDDNSSRRKKKPRKAGWWKTRLIRQPDAMPA